MSQPPSKGKSATDGFFPQWRTDLNRLTLATPTSPTRSGGHPQYPIASSSRNNEQRQAANVNSSLPANLPPETPITGATTRGPALPHPITSSLNRLSIPSAFQPDSEANGPSLFPHCVGTEHIEGKGEYYAYEDGQLCPIIVEGQAVRPYWGLTKSNKPRRRLPAACLRCRAGKIKCVPIRGTSMCQRCQNLDMECKWAGKGDDEGPSSPGSY